MSLAIEKETIPLVDGPDGVIRVECTRVTLDTVVAAFNEGATPEEIVHQYPSLSLAGVYAVIGYYLRRHSEINDYLREREVHRETVRAENENRNPSVGIRQRLVERRTF